MAGRCETEAQIMRSYAGLTPEDLARDLDQRLRLADAAIDAAVGAGTDAERLTYLDAAARHVNAGRGRSGSLWAVHPDAAIRDAATAQLARIAAWRAAAFSRADLSVTVEAIDEEALDVAGRGQLKLWRTSARMAGGHLDDAGRAELARLLAQAAELESAISKGFVADTPVMELDDNVLATLPQDVAEAFELGATSGTRRVRVEYGTREDIMRFVDDRAVRERYWYLLQDRARAANTARMAELFRIRRAIARLAGFMSWAALRTSLMAFGTPAAAAAALDDLAGAAHEATRSFIAACEAALGEELDDGSLQPWDVIRGRAALARGLGVDAAALRSYLPLDAVVAGLFALVRGVFGIRVEELPDRLGWHEDVRTIALFDDATGERIGTCLWDPFAREGKMAGTDAFMEMLEADPQGPGGAFSPVLTMLVTMFPEPPADRPLTLSIDNVDGLFHEFGHVLDFTIGSRVAGSLEESWWGTDFAEGPSFFLASWARSPQVLATFARDPVSGEPVPADAIARLGLLQALEDIPFLERYIALGRLDLAVHGPADVDLDEAWRAAWADNPLAEPSGGFRPFPMANITNGYDAALYGIPYALAVRDELLGVFEREGWLDPATGRRYVERLLGPGPFVSPFVRLEGFLGRQPGSEPLMQHLQTAVTAAARASAVAVPDSGVGRRRKTGGHFRMSHLRTR